MKRTSLVVMLTVVALVATTTTAWAAPLAEQTPGALDKLSEVLGALALFAAMMAVLALGTEVVIDTVKVVVGLKSKPTSLEAIQTYADRLPSQLRELGLSEESSNKVKSLAQDLQQALQPVQRAQEFTLAAKAGDLKGAFGAADQILHLPSNQNLQALQSEVGSQLRAGLATILVRLKIPTEQAAAIVNNTAAVSAQLDQSNVKKLLLDKLLDASTQIVQSWMQGQEESLAKSQQQAVKDLFEAEVAPALKQLGLGDDQLQAMRGQVDQTLAGVTTYYLESVRQLLQAVQDRRAEIQSPLRKLWRIIRDWPILGKGIGPFKFKAAGFPDGFGLLTWIEALFNRMFDRRPSQDELIGQAEPVPPLTLATLASYLMRTSDEQRDEETSRLRILRVISAFVGIYLAYLLQVNAISLLADTADTFVFLKRMNEVVSTAQVLAWLDSFWPLRQLHLSVFAAAQPGAMDLNAGIFMSGLAASAGSAYWHDQLERLQVAKKAVGQVEKLVEAVRPSSEA